jgi:cytolysin-activating lysine-acyltransferase
VTVAVDGARAGLTVSHIFGEMVWLMTQSARHAGLPTRELAWQLMPAIANRQFHLFHEGERPFGVALWAMLDEANEQKLIGGTFHPPYADAADWQSGDRCWLIDLVAPFADDTNKQADVMFGDLVTGVFKGQPFKMLRVDPASGERQVVAIDGDLGERLSDHLREVLG